MAKKKPAVTKPKPVKAASQSFRAGDHFIHIETLVEEAVIDFNDILEATTVEMDDRSEAPWDDCDGYEHDLVKCYDEYEPGRSGQPRRGEQYREWRASVSDEPHYWVRHYNRDHLIYDRHRSQLIVIDQHTVKAWGVRSYAHANGASKQVAAEREAANLRATYEQLIKWYRNGWYYYGVTCTFGDFHDSIWGVDDEEYADTVVRGEIASNVAHEMIKAGYTVVNMPVYNTPQEKRDNLRSRIAHNLGFEKTEQYLKWLAPEHGED